MGNLILNLIFLATTLFAVVPKVEDEEPDLIGESSRSSKWIARKYREGEFLIADCDDRFIACVTAMHFEYCDEKKEDTYEQNRPASKRNCKFIKKFETPVECNKSLQIRVDTTTVREFCH